MLGGQPHVTLENCDREPIHIPGAIQPHGALLALTEPEWVVVSASENIGDLVGVSHAEAVGAPIERLFTREGVAALREAATSAMLRDANPIRLATASGSAFDGILHRTEGLLILELERSGSTSELSFGQFYRRVRKALARLRETTRVGDLASLAAEEIRVLTGFDRVMVYRFAADASGEVIAESKRDGLEAFLGLHYPASDIPAQARRLYVLNWLRLIVDVDYRPVPVVPATNPKTGKPLDMSFATLRSVSPIHCEYLRNMGVRASMSISLVVDGKLWGLVACHHNERKFVPYEARAASEFLGEALSWQIAARERSDMFERKAVTQRVLSRLLEQLSTSPAPTHALAGSDRLLLDLVGACGAAFIHDGKRELIGQTPPKAQVDAFLHWLAERPRQDAFVSEAFASEHPNAPPLEGIAGVLAVAVSERATEWLVWFRQEVERTVRWGGDPEKKITIRDGVPRLSPRGSFALWKETVSGHAVPWEPWLIDIAHELRNALLGGIQERAVELARLNEELRASDLAKDEFLATVSHELRTPLNAMLGWLRLLETGQLPEEKRAQALETVARNARSQAQLVEDLLDVARISTGKMRLDVQMVLPGSVIENAIESVQPAAQAKNIRLQRVIDPKAGPIMGDAQRLQQVVWNLLTNAVKFTPKNGRISVYLRRVESSVEIVVSDNGAGIAPEFVPRVFERFAQAESASTRSQKGLGLGLSIVRHLVELHGGQVEVTSEGEGKGAAFTVRLPVASFHEVRRRHPSAAADSDRPAAFPPATALAGLRILVVDDERDTRELAVATLAPYDVAVSVAASAQEALDVLGREQPDILISDIGMPEVDGHELLRRIRALGDEAKRRVPAVALTAFARTQDRSRAFLSGFDAFLTKPVDPAELVALLVSLADRQKGRPTPRATLEEPIAASAVSSGRSLRGVRVLVVDDDLDTRELLAEVFEGAGAVCVAAEDAGTAIAAARSFRPEVIVSDLGLPDADGATFLRNLRAFGPSGGGHVPAVALTGRVWKDPTASEALAGFQLHVGKPVEISVLLARVAEALEIPVDLT